jgi:hypothetical protein
MDQKAKGKLIKNMRVGHIYNNRKGIVVKGSEQPSGPIEVEWEDGTATVAASRYLEPIKKEKIIC